MAYSSKTNVSNKLLIPSLVPCLNCMVCRDKEWKIDVKDISINNEHCVDTAFLSTNYMSYISLACKLMLILFLYTYGKLIMMKLDVVTV